MRVILSAESIFSLTRRRALDFFLGGGALALLATISYPIFRFFLPSKHIAPHEKNVRAGKKSEFQPSSAKHFRMGTQVGILIRTPSGEYRAFNAQCTHLNCTVQYRPDLEHIWCACHDGHFDLFGRNIKGPPPRPLVEYKVRLRGEDIFVKIEGPGHHGS